MWNIVTSLNMWNVRLEFHHSIYFALGIPTTNVISVEMGGWTEANRRRTQGRIISTLLCRLAEFSQINFAICQKIEFENNESIGKHTIGNKTGHLSGLSTLFINEYMFFSLTILVVVLGTDLHKEKRGARPCSLLYIKPTNCIYEMVIIHVYCCDRIKGLARGIMRVI